MVIWFTGQPGSGKTTLANRFIEDKLIGFMKIPHWKIVHLDGDDVRKVLAREEVEDYSKQGRYKNINWAIDTSIFLVSKGYLPVVSLVSPYRWLREGLKSAGKGVHWRGNQPKFKVLEVYCHTSETRGKEDYFVEDYEPPFTNFLDMDTTNKSIEECVNEILDVYRSMATVA